MAFARMAQDALNVAAAAVDLQKHPGPRLETWNLA